MPTTRQLTRFVCFAAAAIVMTDALARAFEGPNASPEKEAEFLSILRSDGPAADKAIACKQLAIYGSPDSVPELARLLPDERLSSWARIALEAIPGSAADEALRQATNSLEGKLLVGTLNSIGVRRDAAAVDLLVGRIQDPDAEVASAAAVALGRIGNDAAAKSLRKALGGTSGKVRSAVAEGCVLCAEHFLVEGQDAEAVEIYDEVRKADVPRQRLLEATRGAILARKDKGIPLLLEQFQSKDKDLFNLGLSTAREFPGRAVDESLATELARATPDRAALIVVAMADRKDTVVLPAVLKAAGKGPKQVRIAAIGALGRVGDASCLSPLLNIALENDDELVQSAKTALGELPGEKIDAEIVSRLSKAEGKIYPLLIELVGQRRIEAMAALVKALDNSDKTVRSAALTALGATVTPKGLSVLITQSVAPKHPEDAQVAQTALKTASVRMPDREVCATELSAALDRSPVPTKTALLQILGAVGGTKSLETIGAAAKNTDPQLQDTATKLLGEWMTADAAPVLLDLSKSAPDEKYKVRALRGYIRIARQFTLSEQERIDMCQKAYDASRQTAEKKLVIDVLKRYPNIENLKLAVKAMQVPDLKEDATQAVLVIAQKLPGKADEVKELLSKAGLEKVKLEIIKAEYGSGTTQKDVTDVLKKQIGDLPILTLASPSYNASFGGDPTPGTAKKLKIQYKINGKAGEATFAEDALIVLPIPK